MTPDSKDKLPKAPVKARPQGIRLNPIQRFPHGSGATNTLNIPPPPPACYVDHLLIREKWGEDKSEEPKETKKHRDPAVIAKDIEKYQKALEMAYYRLDDEALDESDDYEAKKKKIKDIILRVQERLINLDLERIAAESSLAPYKAPTGIREFVIVEHIQPKIQDVINLAENKLKPLRAKLNAVYDDWYKIHTDHEDAKKELMEFAKKKQKLADARDKARNDYEAAVRREKDMMKAKEASKRKEAFKKLFKKDVHSRQESAQKDKAQAKEKFLAAQNTYREFAFHRYGQIRTREKQLYKKLVDALEEIHTLTNQIGEIEAKVREAKNTLVSGSRIQMTAFGDGEKAFTEKTREFWRKKAPTVTVELDGKTRFFNEDRNFCRDEFPKRNGPLKHPHLHVEDATRGSSVDKGGAPSLKFKIFEFYPAFLTPRMRPGLGVVSGLFELLRHIFSAFPKKRYYKILAEACGFMPTGMRVPERLEAELEVFPADVYTIAIKTQPGFGYENVVRDEKWSYTKGIKGEVAYSDAENAASDLDHNVNKGESFSVLGVVQSSSTTTVTKGADGREIVTQTTMKRDGIFGTATITDTSTGTFDGTTAYSSTMQRTATIGSPLTDDPGGQLVSLQQTYISEDGTVRDDSKVVDSKGVATAITEDDSTEAEGTQSSRPPSFPSTYLPQIPIDIVLSRNGIEDPLTEDLRRTLGLIIFLVRKCGDIAGRMGNFMPSVGWKFGFSMTFLTGMLSYTHGHREHVDWRVWLHHKFDIDLNIVTAKVYLFGGASVEMLLFMVQIGLEIYIKGLIGVKGNFERTHPDADKGWDIGFGPTGGIGIGAEAKAIVGQPDWFMASGTIETVLGVEAIFWARKVDEAAPFLEAAMKWEGVKLKGVLHVILVGHWETEKVLCKERELWSGRFPKEQKEEEIKKMLADQTNELEESNRQRAKEAAALEKKLIKRGIKPAKITK